MKRVAAVLMVLFLSAVELSAAEYSVEKVRKQLLPVSFKDPKPFPEESVKYFKYYGLDFPGVDHLFGTFESGGKKLALHVFRQKGKSKGTVLLVHGYYDHTGVLNHLIKAILDGGYSVVVYDQPGHGLSEGATASIDDFSEYAGAVKDAVKLCRKEMVGPFYIAAHSMGCAAVTEYLLESGDKGIKNVVMLAPLIRSAAWHVSGFGMDLAGEHLRSVPRKFRKNSSDKEFLKSVKKDPLQPKVVPMKWVQELRKWNEKAVTFSKSKRDLLVIQGTKDTTVDKKFNMKYLKSKFPSVKIVEIKGGGHQLMNESLKMRNAVLKDVVKCLGK